MQRLNIHYLKDSLETLCKKLNQDYCINFGGCCFLSFVIANNLDKLGIKYNLVVYHDEKKNILGIAHEVVTMNYRSGLNSITKGNTCYHYTLQIIGAGIINKMSSQYTYIIQDISAINIYWIYKTGDWNKNYNVNHNKNVSTLINNFFNKIKNEKAKQKHLFK